MKICFLSLSAYPLLSGEKIEYIGGAEIQQVLLAKELVKHGYTIYFITYRHSAKKIENMDGIKIIETYEREKADQMNILVKYASILSALKKANADIYFHSAGAPGVLPVFCHLSRKKFIFRIPSDAIVLCKSLSRTNSSFMMIANMLEIKKADIIIAQTEFQKKVLEERFGVKSIVIKNMWKIPPEINYEKSIPPIVLWVGSLTSNKRPDLFIKLAESIPFASFEIIGRVSKTEMNIYESIISATQRLSNFKYHGFIPPNEIDQYFRKASILVNTSVIEGFPNTFLHAWSHCVPVVSLNVDPDGIICRYRLGFHSKTLQQLISDVVNLLMDEKLRREMGYNGRKYVEKEHNIDRLVKAYVDVFEKLMSK